MSLSCVVVDDEDLAVDLLQRFILTEKKINLLAAFSSSAEALAFINNKKPQLLFLDIQMPGLTGIELIKRLSYKPIIIFVTAFSEFAPMAFDLDVVDYLLKPYTKARFERSVSKTLAFHQHTSGGDVDTREEFIYAKHNGILEKIKYEDILFIQGMKQYLKIVTRNKNYLVLRTIKSMEDTLPPGLFVRVHKSYIVRREAIVKIHLDKISIDVHSIPIGRLFKKNLRE